MSEMAEPDVENSYQGTHVSRMLNSLFALTGKKVVPSDLPEAQVAEWVFHAPFALISHNTEADPVFNYANRQAMEQFEMNWEQITSLPSRLSAEPLHRDERARLMAEVAQKGYISNYGGVRISRNGRRFRIEDAIVWNIRDEDGKLLGQAAMFDHWTPVE